MTAYYNEFDPGAAAWLKELITRGLIPHGDVDTRDMRDVQAAELRGYTQHHFFAGIGGWAYALRLAGWPDDRPVLTGSPPCQPFSSAGKQLGIRDHRHLAPHFLELVAALRPAWVFGEQVAAAVNKDDWLDDLLDALEAEGYTTGAAVLPACGLGAPHIRQRLWFSARLGDTEYPGLEGWRSSQRGRKWPNGQTGSWSSLGGLAQPQGKRSDQGQSNTRRGYAGSGKGQGAEPERVVPGGGMAQPHSARPQQGSEAPTPTRYGNTADTASGADRPRPANAPTPGWHDPDWLFCRDGKWRPVEPGTFPLAHGVSARVGRLRGYGNAIVPQVAAEIIRAAMESA